MGPHLGHPVPQIDWRKLTSGGANYTADLSFPGLLTAKVLRSPYPYAHIASIDVTWAERMPGVHAVITIADFKPGARYEHEGARDRPPLADGLVRFVGQEVAAVAAETAQLAAAAVDAIDIVYKPRPAPLTIAAALRRDSLKLHQRRESLRNVSRILRRRWGNAERLAGVVRVEGRFMFGRQTHACMEPNSVVALWNQDEGRLHLWASTQSPIFIRDEVAHLLDLRLDQVVCHEVFVGGGFGSKSRISEHEVIAGALARKAGRPVRLVLDRSEEFETTKSRHPFHMRMALLADADGRLRGIDGSFDVENGAYDHSGVSVVGAGLKGLGLIYRPDGIALEARLIDTAILPGGQFRGYGTTQAMFALECLMDDLAHRLQRDPIDVRIQNAALDGNVSLVGAQQLSVRLQACLATARREINWDQLRAMRPAGQGVGVASGVHTSGSYAERDDANRSDAAIDLHADGRVRLRFGGADSGTGQRTVLAQIVADELSLPMDAVDVLMMDTEKAPFDLGAWSSRGTHYSGHAVRQAAEAARAKLFAIASGRVGGGALAMAGGAVCAGEGSVSIAQLVGLSNETVDGVLTVETSFVDTNVVRPNPQTGFGNMSASYNFAAHAAHVRVDVRTGEVKILDYVAVHDAGKVLNPLALQGQIAGGALMGIGAALGEQMIFEQGKLANSGYIYYALPRAGDAPPIRPFFVDSFDPRGPYGAKAVGELGINPPVAAISNAVFDAIGIRIAELPITPDKIITALAARDQRQRSFRLWRRPDRWWIALVRWLYPRGLFALLHAQRRHRPSRVAAPDVDELAMPATLPEALRLLAGGMAPLGGGTDILPRRDQGLAPARRLLSVVDVPERNAVTTAPDGGLVIGAAVTLARLCDPALTHPLLAAAATSVASPQIRNVATLAGNLVQDKRCWFYRGGFECFKRAGPTAPCYAITGDHRFYHAAIGGRRCQAVTPSDMATALIALDAELLLCSTRHERRVAASSFYTGPGETVLADDELVVVATISAAARRRRGVFEKMGLWDGDFAIVSAALTAEIDASGQWHDLRIVCGGIAPVPWRAVATENSLRGTVVTPQALRRAIDLEIDAKAHPLARNAWKLDALAGLCERAVERMSNNEGRVTG